MGMFCCKKVSRRDNRNHHDNCIDRDHDGKISNKESRKAQRNGLFNNQNNCQPVANSCSYVITPTCTFSNSNCSTNSCGPSVISHTPSVTATLPTDVQSSESTQSLVDKDQLKLNDDGTITLSVETNAVNDPIAYSKNSKDQQGGPSRDQQLTYASPNEFGTIGIESKSLIDPKVGFTIQSAGNQGLPQTSRKVSVTIEPNITKFRIDVGGKTYIIDREEVLAAKKGAGDLQPAEPRRTEKTPKDTAEVSKSAKSEKATAPDAPVEVLLNPDPSTGKKSAEKSEETPAKDSAKSADEAAPASKKDEKVKPEAKSETASTEPKADETKKEVHPAWGAVGKVAGWLGDPLGTILNRVKKREPKPAGADKPAEVDKKASPEVATPVGTVAEATAVLSHRQTYKINGLTQENEVERRGKVSYYLSDKADKVAAYNAETKSLTVYERNSASDNMVATETKSNVNYTDISKYLDATKVTPVVATPVGTVDEATAVLSRRQTYKIDGRTQDDEVERSGKVSYYLSDKADKVAAYNADTKSLTVYERYPASPNMVATETKSGVNYTDVNKYLDAPATKVKAEETSASEEKKPVGEIPAAGNMNIKEGDNSPTTDNSATPPPVVRVNINTESPTPPAVVPVKINEPSATLPGSADTTVSAEPSPVVSTPVGELSKVEELIANPIKNYKAYHKESDTLSARSEDDKVAYYVAEDKTVLVHDKNSNLVSDYVAGADGKYAHNVVHKTKDVEAALDYIKQSLESFMSTEVKAPTATTPEVSLPVGDLSKVEELVKNLDANYKAYDKDTKALSARTEDEKNAYYVAEDKTVLVHDKNSNLVSDYVAGADGKYAHNFVHKTKDVEAALDYIKQSLESFMSTEVKAPTATTPEVSLPVGDLSKVEELVKNLDANYKAYDKDTKALSARTEDEKNAYYVAEDKTVLVHDKNSNLVSDYVAGADGKYAHNFVHKTKDVEAALDYIKQSLESFMSTEVKAPTATTPEVSLPVGDLSKVEELVKNLDANYKAYDKDTKALSARTEDEKNAYYVAEDKTVLVHDKNSNLVSDYVAGADGKYAHNFVHKTKDVEAALDYIKQSLESFMSTEVKAPTATTPEVSTPVGDLSKVEELIANPIKNYKAYHKESDTLSARSEDDTVAYYEAEDKTVLVHNKNTNEVSDYVAGADGKYTHNAVHEAKNLEAALDYIKQSLESFMSTEVIAPEPTATPEATLPAPGGNPEPAAGTDVPLPTPPEIIEGAATESATKQVTAQVGDKFIANDIYRQLQHGTYKNRDTMVPFNIIDGVKYFIHNGTVIAAKNIDNKSYDISEYNIISDELVELERSFDIAYNDLGELLESYGFEDNTTVDPDALTDEPNPFEEDAAK